MLMRDSLEGSRWFTGKGTRPQVLFALVCRCALDFHTVIPHMTTLLTATGHAELSEDVQDMLRCSTIFGLYLFRMSVIFKGVGPRLCLSTKKTVPFYSVDVNSSS